MDNSPTRREFIHIAAGLAATAAAGRAQPATPVSVPHAECPGIIDLRSHTPRARLQAMRRFYDEALGCPAETNADGELTVRTGGTRITFAPTDEAEDAGPYYHFAFNIPENKLAAAKTWLVPRSPLLKRPDGSDQYHFASWNAHAVYFNDPAGNILEFIARHSLPNAAPGDFTPADILYASEIALVVDDVAAAAASAAERLGLGVFAGSQSDQFAALGDDHRLLIIVKRARAWNSGHGRVAEVWPAHARIRAAAGRFASDPFRFEVLAVPSGS
jgi:catechol-2,3-dioxygenase